MGTFDFSDAEISKSKKSETLGIVGKLSTWDSWIIKNENKLFFLNPTRYLFHCLFFHTLNISNIRICAVKNESVNIALPVNDK